MRGSERGRHLREMLDELGPTFVKFGQLLSTRPDVVPPDIVAELRALQDDVRPFPFAQARAVVEGELGLTLEQAFLRFEETPIAAASIGQVHRATLPNGAEVVVKVQRPNAPGQIESDLALLYQAARMIKERVRALDFIDAHELVDEFARNIRQELDYKLEARHADTFRRNFAGSELVRRAEGLLGLLGRRACSRSSTSTGVQLADLDLEATPLQERRELAYRATEAWMEMIFRHGFFHGDPHPANMLVLDGGRIGLVDFGLVGKLTEDDMARLTALFVDAATENVDALPRRLAELGVRYPKEREEEFRTELRELFYRYYGASLAEIDPIQVIREAFGLIYSMNLRLPARFVLLDKAIATLGAVGVDLYPEFNVFEVARPYARELMLERFSPRRLAFRAQKQGRELYGIARELPYQLHDVLEEVRDGQIEIGFVHKGLDEFMHRIDVVFNRLVIALIVAGGLLGSSLIGIFATDGPQILGIHVLSVLGFVLSGMLGAWLLLGVLRSGRLTAIRRRRSGDDRSPRLRRKRLDRAADGEAGDGAARDDVDAPAVTDDAEAVPGVGRSGRRRQRRVKGGRRRRRRSCPAAARPRPRRCCRSRARRPCRRGPGGPGRAASSGAGPGRRPRSARVRVDPGAAPAEGVDARARGGCGEVLARRGAGNPRPAAGPKVERERDPREGAAAVDAADDVELAARDRRRGCAAGVGQSARARASFPARARRRVRSGSRSPPYPPTT